MDYVSNPITASNKSPLVQVLALMFMAIAFLSCAVRVCNMLYRNKMLDVDDRVIVGATMTAIGQTIAIYIAAEHGLGRHFDTLSDREADVFFKSQYAANALFTATMLGSKLAGTMGLHIIIKDSQRTLVLGMDVFAGLWGTSALFVSLFQCRLPTPWLFKDPKHCINLSGFHMYFSILNILTDVAIVVVMFVIVARLHTKTASKVILIALFGSRILVAPALAVQIFYTNRGFRSADPSFAMWPAALAMSLVQCLSILTGCLPNFKAFFDSIESGQIRVDDLRRQGRPYGGSDYPENRPEYLGGSHNYEDTRNAKDAHEMDHISPSSSGLASAQTQAVPSDEPSGTPWDGQSKASLISACEPSV